MYAPADPERLLSYLGEQQERLQETSAAIQQIIPSLKHQLQENQSEYRAEIFEGLRGIRNFFDLSKQDLRKGDVLYTLGYNSMASQLFSGYFKEYHAWKDKQKIYSKVIFTYDAWFGKKREKRKYAEQRYLPKGVSPPGFMHFFKDWVGLIILTEKQKLCIAVKNQELADSYVQYFNLLWKQSVPGK